MTLDSTARSTKPLLLVAFAFAIAALAAEIGSMLTGHHVPWTSWALPMLLVGNIALMLSGVNKVRPRLAQSLWAGSIALALTILAAELHTLFSRAA